MTMQEMHVLREGDCIQSRLTGQTYLVTGNYGDHVIAVQTVHVTHADEWDLAYAITGIAKAMPPRQPQEDPP